MKDSRIDGLRGLAACNVAISHFVLVFFPQLLHHNYPEYTSQNADPSWFFSLLSSPFLTIFYGGNFSVMLFFVMSGYVLTMPYFQDSPNHKIVLKKRFCGRYFRLNIPAAAAILISFIFYKSGWYYNLEASEIAGCSKWFGKMLPSDLGYKDLLNEAVKGIVTMRYFNFLPPLWSIQIELLGSMYLLLFCIIAPRRLAPLLILPLFCAVALLHGSRAIYYCTIFCGMLMHYVKLPAKASLVCLIVGAYFAAFQHKNLLYSYLWNFPENEIYYYAIGAVLMFYGIISGGYGAKILQSKLAQFLGKISFSLYLVHFIVLGSLASILYIHFHSSIIAIFAVFIIYFAACISVAFLFESLVDRFAIKLAHKIVNHSKIKWQ